MSTLTIINAGHTRSMPSGYKVARVLKAFLRRQRDEIAQSFRLGLPPKAPDLSHWTQPMADALTPLLLRHFQDGQRDAARRLAYQTGRPLRRRSYRSVRKMGAPPDSLSIGFDVFNPQVLEAVKRLTLQFCQATNETSTMRLDDALRELRQQLAEGLQAGETLKDLTRRVQGIFADPERAQMIAASETSRAMHAGQLMAAKESGVVVGKRWLASSDACDLCLKLNGKEVGLEEDFAVDGGGPYAHIPYPPRH